MRGRLKSKGRGEGGRFFGLPHAVLDSANYAKLSSKAVKLMNDMGRQFNGHNNGDLCAAFSLMAPRGWVSKATLEEAINELRHFGMIELTRQGGRHMPSLYALSWHPIDECKGKLDARETSVPSKLWSKDCPDYVPLRKRRQKKAVPQGLGQGTPANGAVNRNSPVWSD